MTKQRSRSSESNTRFENGKGGKNTDSAIIAALIGLAGTILAAIIGYLAIQYQTDTSIRATQSAQETATMASIQAAASSSQTPQIYTASQTLAPESQAATISAPVAKATELFPTDTLLPPIVKKAPSPTATDFPTPTPTPTPVSISNCAHENDWMVNPVLRDSIFTTDGGCLNLSKFHITVSGGLKIDFINNEGGRRTYNLYSSKKITAPSKTTFTLKIDKLAGIPDDGEDLSIYAGFVNGFNNRPDWLPASYSEGAQGNFIIFRLLGTDVRVKSISSTRYLLFDTNIHNPFQESQNIMLEKYLGETQSIDITLNYREAAIEYSWRPTGQSGWTRRTFQDKPPDPAYFVFGYSAPRGSIVQAVISDIAIMPGE